MQIHRDIPYAPGHGERGLLDIVCPEGAAGRPVVVVIHGGGMEALSKERMDGVAAFIAERGLVAVNVNYRLLPAHPFPAPLEDVLTAIRWVGETDLEPLRSQDRARLALLGPSAGGYLALAAGLILGRERVRGIVSISGPATRVRPAQPREGTDTRLLAPPVGLVTAEAPRLLAVHSRNDGLVPPEESRAIVARVRGAGVPAELLDFDGPGKQHGIWRDDTPRPRLHAFLEDGIAAFLHRVLADGL